MYNGVTAGKVSRCDNGYHRVLLKAAPAAPAAPAPMWWGAWAGEGACGAAAQM